jgi:hypothetical protein
MTPGETVEEHPHHFVVVRADGDRRALEVISPHASGSQVVS